MRLKTIGLLSLAILIVTGCSSNPGTDSGNSATNNSTTSTSGSSGPKLTIAVIPKGATHEYWKAMHAGADAAAKDLGVTVIWKGPVQEDDREGQIQIVEDFINQGVNGIVLAPLDVNALRAPVKEANDKKIPVLIVDSGLNNSDVVSMVATNNEKGGEMAGDYLAKLLGGKGTVMMLRYEVGSASTDARERGFLAAMARNPGITIASDNQYGGATVDTAQKAAESLVTRFKRADGSFSVGGIFTPNESTAIGMLKVLQSENLAGKVKFVGFDSAPPLIEGMKAHQIDGIIVQDPYKMGNLGVKMLVDFIHGKKVDKNVDTGATLVTPDNLNQPAIQKLVSPPEE